MARNESFDRRTVLRGASGVLFAGALAGCSSGSNGETGTQGGDESTAGSGGETEADGTTAGGETSTTDTGGAGGASAQVEQYLAEAEGYDGSIADMPERDTVEVAVGTGETGYAFDPAAVHVSPGTTVRWAWTGEGGAHNVVSKGSGPLDSGQPQAGSSVTYQKTLERSGTYPYYCEPHRSLGMKGVIIVGGNGGESGGSSDTTTGTSGVEIEGTAASGTETGSA